MKKLIITSIFVLLVYVVGVSAGIFDTDNTRQLIEESMNKSSIDKLLMLPDAQDKSNKINFIGVLILAVSFFLIAISSFYFVISADNVQLRLQAKEYLYKSIFLGVFSSVGLYIFGLLIELSGQISREILSKVNIEFFTPDIFQSISNLIFSVPLFISLTLVQVISFIFNIFLATGYILVPVGVIMYCFNSTKPFAKLIFQLMGYCLLMPVINAFILYVSVNLNAETFIVSKILVLLGACIGIVLIDTLALIIITFTCVGPQISSIVHTYSMFKIARMPWPQDRERPLRIKELAPAQYYGAGTNRYTYYGRRK